MSMNYAPAELAEHAELQPSQEHAELKLEPLDACQPAGGDATPAAGQKAPPVAQGVPQPSNISSTAEAIRAAGEADAARLSALGTCLGTASAAQLSAGADRVETTARWEGGTLASVETTASRSPQPVVAPARAELDALIATGQHDRMAAAATGIASVSGPLGRLTREARVAEHQETEKKLAETRATFERQSAEIAQRKAELSCRQSTYDVYNRAKEQVPRSYAALSQANRELRDAELYEDELRYPELYEDRSEPPPLERAPGKYHGFSMPPAVEEQLRAHALAPEQRGAVLEAQADEYIRSKVAPAEAKAKELWPERFGGREPTWWTCRNFGSLMLNRQWARQPEEMISSARQEAQVWNHVTRPHACRPSACHALFPHAVNAATANSRRLSLTPSTASWASSSPRASCPPTPTPTRPAARSRCSGTPT